MKQEYPRMLYLHGLDDEKTNVIVQGDDEEQAHRAQGYGHHGEAVEPDEPKAPAKRGRKPKGV